MSRANIAIQPVLVLQIERTADGRLLRHPACHLMENHVFTGARPLAGVVLIRDSLQLDGAFMVPWLVREAVLTGMKVLPWVHRPCGDCTWS